MSKPPAGADPADDAPTEVIEGETLIPQERRIGSDLAKIDAHVIQPEEYDELPEWTDEMFERADLYQGGKLVQRGKPRPEKT